MKTKIDPNIIDRPPRILSPLPIEQREIPPPPAPLQQQQAWMRLLLPLMVILAYLLISLTGRGRNIFFMLPMSLMMFGTAMYSFISYRNDQKASEEAIRQYDDRLRQLRREMNALHDEQRLFFYESYPSPEDLITFVNRNRDNRFGSRLWERRPSDHDFGAIRLGQGDIRSTILYQPAGQSADDAIPDLQAKAKRLAADSYVTVDAPVTIHLRPHPALSGERENLIEGRNSIGISGQKNPVTQLSQSIALQLIMLHTPQDLQLYVIGAPDTTQRWKWAQWLPHTNSSEKTYIGDRMCFYPPAKAGIPQPLTPSDFWKHIDRILDDRITRLEDGSSAVDLPFIVIIVDNLSTGDQKTSHWLDEITGESAVNKILRNGQMLGAAILYMVEDTIKIPADFTGIIEVKRQRTGSATGFRYSEIGLNSQRYIGTVDRVPIGDLNATAQKMKDLKVRVSYGADLPNMITVLQMNDVNTIAALKIADRWADSKKVENADWLRVRLGSVSGGDYRELHLYANGDGVHGMIAGTTGSGKSELLQTMITQLAINYDPEIINFVLVDYKGGQAFDMFKKLPHVVDIVTNLKPHAVERMFMAIGAEIDRRTAILTESGATDIVNYRERGLHLNAPLPHLMVIVDEFAEMITANGEYKTHFERITRVGRSVGVHLILATQRPTGKVTDQMKANMKFRICLRVETVDDSRELLGRPDAKFLPSRQAGRGYVQAGGDNLTLVQVAWSGAPYEEVVEMQQVDFRVIDSSSIDTGSLSSVDEPEPDAPTMLRSIIDTAHSLAARQKKPWPDSLPDILPLNLPVSSTYFRSEEEAKESLRFFKSDEMTLLNLPVASWVEYKDSADELTGGLEKWQQGNVVDWSNALSTTVGLIDIPTEAYQARLKINFASEGHLVLYGASGWGKTICLATVLVSLAARHSPRELHLYAMDFGRGGLQFLSDLPHLAETIDINEAARIERLLRILENMISIRENIVRVHGSLMAYNQHLETDEQPIPAVIVAIDNFAEFRDNYENFIPRLISIARAGRAMGMYFAITANRPADIPGKFASLLTQRLTLKLSNRDDYMMIVGRGVPQIDEVPGRGYIEYGRMPQVFQIGIPAHSTMANGQQTMALFRHIAQQMKTVWGDRESGLRPVEPLGRDITYGTIWQKVSVPHGLTIPLGIRDIDRQVDTVDLFNRGPHTIIVGPMLSGKTTLLKTWVLGLAENNSPEQVVMVLIDPRQMLFSENDHHSLSLLPHVVESIGMQDEMKLAMKRLTREFEDDDMTRKIIMVIDNYDDFGDFEIKQIEREIATFARRYRKRIHIILAGSQDILKSADNLVKKVEASRLGITLQSTDLIMRMGGRVTAQLARSELPVGRGFVVRAGRSTMVQFADFAPHDEINTRLNHQVDTFEPATWHHDITLTGASNQDSPTVSAGVTLPPPPPPGMSDGLSAPAPAKSNFDQPPSDDMDQQMKALREKYEGKGD